MDEGTLDHAIWLKIKDMRSWDWYRLSGLVFCAIAIAYLLGPGDWFKSCANLVFAQVMFLRADFEEYKVTGKKTNWPD